MPIVLTEIAFGVVALFWIMAPITWARAAVFGALFLVIVWVYSTLMSKYERLGQAVPKRSRKKIVFPNGRPAPLRVMRYTVLVPMIAMIGFGMAPLAIARPGIIACVLVLLIMAWVYIGLEIYYENTGRAQEADGKPDASTTQKPGSTA
jgi:hypothetical protein